MASTCNHCVFRQGLNASASPCMGISIIPIHGNPPKKGIRATNPT
ncbi:hypothetical protein KPSA3_03195 [Pseudomonas syringae pv. actinidiae]|uniref:Uncharacterized protein n=1 Tax=Pseudomonas syringae pv. actinidiae TaxID=103796 RepID=A0AAN4Q4V6_PSESF|nr:hypothetical protein KPSA3_03195 [Pseudomonas syringae pv. actinidiae]